MITPWLKSIVWSVACVQALAMTLAAFFGRAEAEEFTAAIQAYLQHCLGASTGQIGIVVGLVHGQGSRVIGCGKLDNGTDEQVDGDTVFEIGSDTKAFTHPWSVS